MATPEEKKALAKALRATSFAEEGAETSLPVFTAWETSDKHGKLLSAEDRTLHFEQWAADMLVKHLAFTQPKAETVVKALITDNVVDSCFSLHSMKDLPRDSDLWKVQPALGNLAALNLLRKLAYEELRVAQGSKSRVLGDSVMASGMGSMAPGDASGIWALAQIHNKKPEDLKDIPGLEHIVAASKKLKKARHMQRLKEERTGSLSQLTVGASPKFAWLSTLDQHDASEEAHPKFNLKKDIVLWADDDHAKEQDPEASMGLATLYAKLDHFLLGFYIRRKLDMVHVENARYRQNFIYRKYGRDIGLAWFQELLDELHRRSQTDEKLPPLKDHLLDFESTLHQAVMETLRTRYPKKVQQDRGSQEKLDKRLKDLETRKQPQQQGIGRKEVETMLKKERSQRGNQRDRSRSAGKGGRGRFRSPQRDPRGGGKGGSAPKKHRLSSTPPANKAFALAKTKGLCPHHNKGECSFGDKCQKDHECILCGKKRSHGAVDCSKWNSQEAKKLLGE